VIACAALHHVADPGEVVGRIADVLSPTGVVIILEWDWESFDEATARWCFERAEPDGWLARRREGWRESGQAWDDYLRDWAAGHGIHSANEVVGALDARFERVSLEHGPYFFAGMAESGEDEEREAIRSGAIRASRIDYVGRPAAA
jgi:SAM-dependent methyltransferase